MCVPAVLLGSALFLMIFISHKVPAYKLQSLHDGSYKSVLVDQEIKIVPEASFFIAAETAAASITATPQMPAMPTPPLVPQQPNGYAPGSYSGQLTVIGVLPPSVVIMQRGGQTITAKVGQDTDFGFIDSISSTGASIDGSWYELN